MQSWSYEASNVLIITVNYVKCSYIFCVYIIWLEFSLITLILADLDFNSRVESLVDTVVLLKCSLHNMKGRRLISIFYRVPFSLIAREIIKFFPPTWWDINRLFQLIVNKLYTMCQSTTHLVTSLWRIEGDIYTKINPTWIDRYKFASEKCSH